MTDRDDDATRPIDPDDDATRAMDADEGEATRAMDADDAATTRVPRGVEVTSAMAAPYDAGPDTTRHIERAAEPTGPHTERIYMQDNTPPMAGWVIAAIIVLALLVGVVIGYSSADPSDNNVLARALVSTEGGTLDFDGRGKVEIPKDALTTGTVITVRKEKIERRVRLGPEGDPNTVVYDPGQLEVYVFEPAGLQFQKEVTITLPRTTNGEGLLVDAKQPRVIPGEVKDDVIIVKTNTFGFDQ
jgi:hypothetical protein